MKDPFVVKSPKPQKDDPRARFWAPEDRIEGEHNDCVVRAAACATGRAYRDVHAIFAKHGRKPGKGTYNDTAGPAFAELGMRRVQMHDRFTHSIRCGHDYVSNSGLYGWREPAAVCTRRFEMTVAQFLRKHPTGRFVLYVRRHAIAVIDGVVWDMSRRFRGRQYVESYFTFTGGHNA